MGLFNSARGMGEIWKIIREVDLNQLHEAAEKRFTVLITGDIEPAEKLALALSSRPGSSGVHPWIRLMPLPLGPEEPVLTPDVALVVTQAADHGLEGQAAVRQLARRGVPVIGVVAGADASQRTGAELPREGEVARVLVA